MEDRLGVKQGHLTSPVDPDRDPIADEWVSTTQAAKMKGVTVPGLHKAIARGDVIAVRSAQGLELARGLANYSAAETRLIARRPSSQIEAALGYAAEPELIALLAPGARLVPVGADAVEAGLPAMLAAAPLDLRTGAFRKRRRWRIDWPLVRRLALLGALCFLVNAAIQLALVLRLSSPLAPAVLDLIGDRPEAALAFVRGDAFRLVGREIDARRAYARAAGPASSADSAAPAADDATADHPPEGDRP